MQNVHFSPPELARLLGVNESTVKRWIDKGFLKASKTPGGHRRITKKDVQTFLKDSPTLKNRSYLISQWSNQTKKDEWREYYNKHVNYRPEEARSLLMAKAIMRGSVQKVLETIVVPTLVEIGEAWNSGEIDIVDEHRMTILIRGDLVSLETLIAPPKPDAPLVALACVPEENHELTLLILSLVARERGWNTMVLGINVPLKQIEHVVTTRKVDVLGLTKAYDKAESTTFIQAVRKLPEMKKLSLCVGGSGWSEKERKALQKISNVTYSNSIQDFVHTLTTRKK
jgi:excisionase family DNA binding protein